MERRERERAERQARESLERVRDEGDVLGGSAVARAAERARRHFGGADAPQGDSVELWGRRIGRTLALAFIILLVVWLVRMLD
ncbi:MAG TPA: hypothetical protein VHG92_02675 [Afifellaceae bacterium]|nr:hypothetical protein [Afifellaceae bacterium]